MPIPPEATEIHGISDKQVTRKPSFNDLSKEILDIMHDCDLGGYNSNNFDIPLLAEEFHRAGIEFSMKNRKSIDVQNIFHKLEKRTLIAAYKFYCNKDLTQAHSSAADINATYEVLLSQLDKYE